jgi:6-pyruvoyltetrahydropterin/6-carboxytetrahydropterin synthase
MAQIRITKEFTFETAHMLKDYDGLCKNIHGHSYKLAVTVIGQNISETGSPKLGMVMDFGDLKKIVNENIVNIYDHALVVNETESELKKQQLKNGTGKLIFTPFQPTCENMVADFARIISEKLPSFISLYSIRLYETANSYAEWYANDNKSTL